MGRGPRAAERARQEGRWRETSVGQDAHLRPTVAAEVRHWMGRLPVEAPQERSPPSRAAGKTGELPSYWVFNSIVPRSTEAPLIWYLLAPPGGILNFSRQISFPFSPRCMNPN